MPSTADLTIAARGMSWFDQRHGPPSASLRINRPVQMAPA